MLLPQLFLQIDIAHTKISSNEYERINRTRRNILKSFKSWKKNHFFDVRSTKAGDYYLTVQKAKNSPTKTGVFITKNIKFICEDFMAFKDHVEEMMSFIIDQKVKVISEGIKKILRKLRI